MHPGNAASRLFLMNSVVGLSILFRVNFGLTRYEILIVGAGPVGLLLASFLGRNGISVLLLEARESLPAGTHTSAHLHTDTSTRAIGVSIPSLEIFERLGLAAKLCDSGVAVPAVHMCSREKELGRVDFRNAGSHFQYVLSIPQGKTCEILETDLLDLESVDYRRGYQVEFIEEFDSVIEARGQTTHQESFFVQGRYLIGCDGGNSSVRGSTGIGFVGDAYGDTFLMGDYIDRTGWGDEAYVFSTPRGSVESFPMPGGLRRYVLSTEKFIEPNVTKYLEEEIPNRCGVVVAAEEKSWESAFTVEHRIATTYTRSRAILAGDSAHLMSPIVGQNMNTGFADVELLSEILPRVLRDESRAGELFRTYDRIRRRAAIAATRRAWLMMRLATTGGRAWSWIRAGFLVLTFRLLPGTIVASLFSMTSIPNRNVAQIQKSHPRTGALRGAD